MKNILRNWPLHTFFVGLYIILFIYVRNLSEVTLSMTYRSVVICLVATTALFGLSYFFLRSVRKAGIFSTLLLIGFFSYGFLYNQLETIFYKGWWPFSHIHRFLLVVYVLFYLFLFLLFFRSKRSHHNSNYALNLFILGVFLLNIGFGAFRLSTSKKNSQSTNSLIASNFQNSIRKLFNNNVLPDVYYIILDGFAGEKTLQKYYHDENPSFYKYLRAKGFYVADSSRANYPFTVVSLSSSLNFTYLDSLNNSYPLNEFIRQNLVNYTFKQANYRLINIESGFAVTEKMGLVDKTISVPAPNEFENRLLELTILRVDDVLGFNHYLRLKGQFERLKLFVKEKGPKFSFIHIVSPHPPYVMNSAGQKKMRTGVSDMAWEPKKDYLEQLKYLSKEIMSFTDLILKSSPNPPIIIIQSDHGPWIADKSADNIYEARSRILNAYYVPDSIKSRLYPGITPVNSFRLIFSELFKENYPLLPDRPIRYSELKENVLFKKYNQ